MGVQLSPTFDVSPYICSTILPVYSWVVQLLPAIQGCPVEDLGVRFGLLCTQDGVGGIQLLPAIQGSPDEDAGVCIGLLCTQDGVGGNSALTCHSGGSI